MYGTTWTDEVNEDIGDIYGQGMWLRTLARTKYLHVEADWKRYDNIRQHKRIETRITKTTGLYKELNPNGAMQGPAPYIVNNPTDTEAIRLIFKLRTGSSTLRADMETRHLATTSTCRLCGI